MDQVKIGEFLKELRKEKKLTQEQLAEQFNVSRRSVSRWETGSNMPDLDILMEISDYYGVTLNELLDGERKSENMDKELEQTVIKVAQYSNEDKLKETRRTHILFTCGCVAALIFMVLYFMEEVDNLVGGACLGMMVGLTMGGALLTSKYYDRVCACKMRLFKRH